MIERLATSQLEEVDYHDPFQIGYGVESVLVILMNALYMREKDYRFFLTSKSLMSIDYKFPDHQRYLGFGGKFCCGSVVPVFWTDFRIVLSRF